MATARQLRRRHAAASGTFASGETRVWASWTRTNWSASGIAILAKNYVVFSRVKINIVDTPGRSDFGVEGRRALKMD
jgi:predicted membrane GTPase involved in stress response